MIYFIQPRGGASNIGGSLLLFFRVSSYAILTDDDHDHDEELEEFYETLFLLKVCL